MSSARTVVAAVLVPLLAGCTLGPDPTLRPPSAADDARAFVHPTAAEEPDLDRWWERLGDPATATLVNEALASSPDALAAAARVVEAEAALAGAAGARWPQVEYGAGASRQKFSFVLPGAGRVGIYSTTFSQDLTISYQVDLFGRLARSRQAAWAAMLAAEADRRAVLSALVAQVVRTRIDLAALGHQRRLAEATTASWEETVWVTEERYRAGLALAGDVHLARQGLEAARATVPAIDRSVATTSHALDVLVGRRPGTGPAIPDTLPELPDPTPPPAGLPAALLDRRPDLVAARMRFAESQARVGVALANLLPSLSLTAGTGIQADEPSALIDTAGLVYSAIANVLAPLFTGGQRRAEVAAARARAEAAAADYARTVLVALAEVEDALAADALLREQLAVTTRQLEAAVAASRLAAERYRRGTASLLEVLVAQRARDAAENALVAVRADLWRGRVALIAALGGGWTPPPPDSAR